MNVFCKPWFVMLGYLFLIKPGVVSGIPALSMVDTMFDICRIMLIALTVLDLLVIPIEKDDSKLTVMLLNFIAELWEIISTLLAGYPTMAASPEEYAAYRMGCLRMWLKHPTS